MGIPGFSMQVSPEGDVLIVKVVGRVPPKEVSAAEGAAAKMIARGYKRVALDFSETEEISSTGLGLAVYYHQMLRKTGGRLVVVRPRGAVARRFAQAKLDGILNLCDTLQEALEAAGKGRDSHRKQPEPA